MSTTDEESREGGGDTTPASPVVGVPFVGEDLDGMLRTTARAGAHGCDAIVALPADVDAGGEATALAERLGARTVRVDDGDASFDTLRRDLTLLADALSYPGVILQTDDYPRIDYDRCIAAVADGQFCVDARAARQSASSRVVVGIPALDEAESIADVVTRARRHAETVLVVDDGSDDETAVRARDAGATVVSHETNRGYGAALKSLFVAADDLGADHLVVLDGDGQHDPADVPKLVATQRQTGAEIVIGSRFAADSRTRLPRYRRLGLWVVNLLTNLSMGVVRARSRIADTQSGFRSYDARAIESLAGTAGIGEHMGASTDILFHAHRRNYDVVEVGTTIEYDVEDASTRNPVSHGLLLVSNILRTIEREHPVLSLGVPGFVGTFVGIGFGYWTVFNYVRTETFPVGIALVSLFFVLSGVLASFTSIILHALNTTVDRRE